jgi:DNA-binding beta-propeller fold protein YncE
MRQCKRSLAFALVLMLLAQSLLLPAEPVNADTNVWSVESIPGTESKLCAPGSDISDLAVASDNTTLYVADSEGGRLYKSVNAGANWTELANPAGATRPQLVAVAPDTISIVAVVADDNEVYITTDGGASWSNLGVPQEMGDGASAISLYDIAVSTVKDGIRYVAVAGVIIILALLGYFIFRLFT